MHSREKADFYRAITLFIKKVLDNQKPRDLQYIYMHLGGDYRLSKDLLTPPRVHTHRLKEMLHIAALLPAGNIPEPNESLALEWYYMLYHKSDREKYVLAKMTLEGAMIESVTLFFQALFESKRLDGTLERQELEWIKQRALREASDAIRRKICDAADSRCTYRARNELAYRGRSSHRSRTSDDRTDQRRIINNDRNDDSRRLYHGLAKHHRNEKGHRNRGDCGGQRTNQPHNQRSAADRGGKARSGGDKPCEAHSSPGRPAKHLWVECSTNLANAKAASVRCGEAYYADDGRNSDDNSRSGGHCSGTASEGEYSCRSDDDDDSHGGDDNYAVAISSVPRKRAKHASAPAEPVAPKKHTGRQVFHDGYQRFLPQHADEAFRIHAPQTLGHARGCH